MWHSNILNSKFYKSIKYKIALSVSVCNAKIVCFPLSDIRISHIFVLNNR